MVGFRDGSGLTIVMLLVIGWPVDAHAMSQKQAVELARAYLASDDDGDRRTLAAKLAGYDGDIDAVLRALSIRSLDAQS